HAGSGDPGRPLGTGARGEPGRAHPHRLPRRRPNARCAAPDAPRLRRPDRALVWSTVNVARPIMPVDVRYPNQRATGQLPAPSGASAPEEIPTADNDVYGIRR